MKNISERWDRNKKIVLSGAQIITIVTLMAGLYGTYSTATQNKSDIATSGQWMKDAIKEQRITIARMEIENAILRTKFDALKERVDIDESCVRMQRINQLEK